MAMLMMMSMDAGDTLMMMLMTTMDNADASADVDEKIMLMKMMMHVDAAHAWVTKRVFMRGLLQTPFFSKKRAACVSVLCVHGDGERMKTCAHVCVCACS